jgi:hypothetical protein
MFIQDKELYKKVRKVEMSKLLPKFVSPAGFDHAVIDENKNILNFCSSRYNLVTNESIFKPIESYMKNNDIKYSRSVRIINNSKFYVDYIIGDRKDTGLVNGIFPKVSIWNSYDGGSTMRHEMGYHRLICSNGLTRPDGEIIKTTFKHAAPSKTEDLSLDNYDKVIHLLQEVQEFISHSDEDMKFFDKMSQVKVTKAKIEAIGKKVKLSKKIIQASKERFDLEVGSELEYTNEYGETVKSKTCDRNLFTVYNALNYGIYNTNLKELPEKKVEKDKLLMRHVMSLI